MPNSEYNYTDKDFELIADNIQSSISDNDYIRLIVFEERPTRDGSRESSTILTYRRNNTGGSQLSEQAIFYSSLKEIPFEINISPFGAGLNEIKTKTIGGDLNDFQIYQNPTGEIYLKPNEVFDKFDLPTGNFKIQGTLSTSPGNTDWYTIQNVDFTNQTGITYYNFTGVWENVRFTHDRASGNTGSLDKLLYRH